MLCGRYRRILFVTSANLTYAAEHIHELQYRGILERLL